MPFEQTGVSPQVDALLRMRAWIATHGFTCIAHDEETGAGCFWYAARQTQQGNADIFFDAILPFLEARQARHGEDLTDYLRRHVPDTATALSVIDAAIASVA